MSAVIPVAPWAKATASIVASRSRAPSRESTVASSASVPPSSCSASAAPMDPQGRARPTFHPAARARSQQAAAQRVEHRRLLLGDPSDLVVRRGCRQHDDPLDQVRPSRGERERDPPTGGPARDPDGRDAELVDDLGQVVGCLSDGRPAVRADRLGCPVAGTVDGQQRHVPASRFDRVGIEGARPRCSVAEHDRPAAALRDAVQRNDAAGGEAERIRRHAGSLASGRGNRRRDPLPREVG